MKKLFAAIAMVGLLMSATAKADEMTQAKAQDIFELLKLTNALQMGSQMGDQVFTMQLQALKQAKPETPQADIDFLRQTVVGAFNDNMRSLVNAIVPVYGKHFTHTEIKGMIEFYKTPLGQKTIARMPAMMQESMAISQQWAMQIMKQIKPKIDAHFQGR